ncbi:MAG: putative metal-binding motif-containing protein [Candidatus Gracilibacteria bacterium]|jgi:hypothetical protein
MRSTPQTGLDQNSLSTEVPGSVGPNNSLFSRATKAIIGPMRNAILLTGLTFVLPNMMGCERSSVAPKVEDTAVEFDPNFYDKDHDGFDPQEGDCNDQDPAINPDAPETFYDGVDQDCDGSNDNDADGDGAESSLYGGTDCDDSNLNNVSDCDVLFNMSAQYGSIGPVEDIVYGREGVYFVGTGEDQQAVTPNSICQLAGFDQAEFARGWEWMACAGVPVSLDKLDPTTLLFTDIEATQDCVGQYFGNEGYVESMNDSYGTNYTSLSPYGMYYAPTSTISLGQGYPSNLNPGKDGVVSCVAVMPEEK